MKIEVGIMNSKGVSDVELPKRKRIRLPDYDYSSPGAYFITLCTKDRRCILSRITVGADVPDGTRPQLTDPAGADAPDGQRPQLTDPVGADALGGPCLQLTDTGKVVEQYILSTERMIGFHVDKYVVMPNHIHMILRIENGAPRASAPTVSDAVGALKRLVNRKVGRDIWQRSFHEHVIRNEHDYREIWEYIDRNPAKWDEDRYYEQ